MTKESNIRTPAVLLLLALAVPASGAILDGATTTFPNAAITRARLGIWSSNETAAMGLALTNLVNDRSVALSNLAYAIGAAGTNYTLAASNSLYTTLAALAYGIGAAATNYTLAASNALAGMSGGDAGGTNSRQGGSLMLTNLSGNPNVATNIIGAGTVTVTSNNLGGWTITGSGGDAGGTNSRQWGSLTLTNISGTGAVTSRTAQVVLPLDGVRLPSTNYPLVATGWRGPELWFSRTNFEGTAVAVSALWQTILPPDYVSNTLAAVVHSTITATNGPNSSNVIWRVNIAAFPNGATNDVRLWTGGSQVSATTTWSASATGTNRVQTATLDLNGNTDGAQAGSLVYVSLDRDVGTDTYVGASAVVGMELRYTRQ